MRQNVIIVLLSVTATLLAVNVFRPSPVIVGQAAGGGTATIGSEFVGATGALAGAAGSAFWLYDAKERKVGVYVLGNQGLELRAIRDLSSDYKVTEMNIQAGKITKVKDVKAAVKEKE